MATKRQVAKTARIRKLESEITRLRAELGEAVELFEDVMNLLPDGSLTKLRIAGVIDRARPIIVCDGSRHAEGVGEKPAWVFEIDEAFTIKGRGTVVTGKPEYGYPKVNDEAVINGEKTIITGVECFVTSTGEVRDIGLLLRGTSREHAAASKTIESARTTRNGEGE